MKNLHFYQGITRYRAIEASDSNVLYLFEHKLSFNGELDNTQSVQYFLSHLDHPLEDVHHPPRGGAHKGQVALVNCSQGEVFPGFLENMTQKGLKLAKSPPFSPMNDKVNLQSELRTQIEMHTRAQKHYTYFDRCLNTTYIVNV